MPTIALVNMDFASFELEEEMAAREGVKLIHSTERDAEHTIANCQEADGIVTSYGLFPAEVFENLPRLKVVSRTGVGYDSIDIEAANQHNVAVCTAPGYANEVVSDHAIALAMACLRRINELDADIKAGIWDFARHRPFGQAKGRVFGVVGMGDIGRVAAKKAAGLGFKVICWSRSLTPGTRTQEGFEVCELDEVLSRADVVSFHTALTPSTFHLLSEARIARMKPSAVVVNTARGPIVDTLALAKALEEGRIWGAGLDVFEEEPVDMNHPIMKAPHTVLSAHAAYWSEESGVELRTRTMQSALDVVLGRRPADCLNPSVFG